jgi:hypothetical protein
MEGLKEGRGRKRGPSASYSRRNSGAEEVESQEGGHTWWVKGAAIAGGRRDEDGGAVGREREKGTLVSLHGRCGQ